MTRRPFKSPSPRRSLRRARSDIFLLVGKLPDQSDDVGWRKNRGRRLMEKRLEDVVIAPVNQNNVCLATFSHEPILGMSLTAFHAYGVARSEFRRQSKIDERHLKMRAFSCEYEIAVH
jgi:hypothetical protein